MTTRPIDPSALRHQRARLLELLRELSYAEREVVLSSGKRSNFYIDCKQVSLHAEGSFLIGQLFCALIAELEPEARAVGGMSIGADPLATATSLVSFIGGTPLHAFYVRKEPKGHGTGSYLEGRSNLGPGCPVVILEDVVTTGASTLRAIERARDGELDVRRVLALVDRDEGGRAEVEKVCPLTPLFVRGDFVA